MLDKCEPVTAGHKIGNNSRLLPGDQWHPLDNVPAPEYIPPVWIGPHVGLRLVEAFKTLSRMPLGGSGPTSGVWPAYAHEWEDLLAQQQADADAKAKEAQTQNRARLMPSAEDVSRMESAIVWPARYLSSQVRVLRAVQRVALYRSRDFDLDAIARRLRRSPEALRLDNRGGLDVIADGLRRDSVPVF